MRTFLLSLVVLFAPLGCAVAPDQGVPAAVIDPPDLEGKGLIPPPSPTGLFPIPPGTTVKLPPMITRMEPGPVGNYLCLKGTSSSAAGVPTTVDYTVQTGYDPIASVRICRNGTCFREIASPSLAALTGTATDPIRNVFDPMSPSNGVSYSVIARDTSGRTRVLEKHYDIEPPLELSFPETIKEYPGSGTIHLFRVSYRTLNGERLGLMITADGSGSGTGMFWIGGSAPFGVQTGTIEIPYDFGSAARYAAWVSAGRPVRAAASGPQAGACQAVAWSNAIAFTLAAAPAPIPPPSTPPPGSGSSGSSPWLPSCSWMCDRDVPGRVVTNYENTFSTCGADASSPRFHYLQCTIDGAPVSTELRVCAIAPIPSGWARISTDTWASTCGGGTSNTNLIRKL